MYTIERIPHFHVVDSDESGSFEAYGSKFDNEEDMYDLAIYPNGQPGAETYLHLSQENLRTLGALCHALIGINSHFNRRERKADV